MWWVWTLGLKQEGRGGSRLLFVSLRETSVKVSMRLSRPLLLIVPSFWGRPKNQVFRVFSREMRERARFCVETFQYV